MNRALAFTSALSLFSGLVSLLVDRMVYKIQKKKKEEKYAKIFGWIQLSLAGTGFLVVLLLQLL
ncbi:CLC_0170 family protein [Paenibacillus rubinfantis]|uniref:CLC_0170 family protein n=1 Tax=Paenibacillus rubinfantis TaxID=1720296 RepID=UPI00073EB04E|nr:CLC_0170 family protein [Paenibacillus rubinfantis]